MSQADERVRVTIRPRIHPKGGADALNLAVSVPPQCERQPEVPDPGDMVELDDRFRSLAVLVAPHAVRLHLHRDAASAEITRTAGVGVSRGTF